MNKYFYVPVTDERLKHVGESLNNHLRVVDSELYERGEVESSFESYDDIELEHMLRTKHMYRERMLPDKLILVLRNGNELSELASKQYVSGGSLDYLRTFEITGLDVAEIFKEFPDYRVCSLNFFDSYSNKYNEEADEKFLDESERQFQKRFKLKLENLAYFFSRKTGN